MTLARAGELVTRAAACHGAVAAFNVITLEHAEAIVTAADDLGSPVILAVSENAVRYHADRMAPMLAACVALASAAEVPVGLHLDHLTDDALVGEALSAPISSMMYDAGALPYAENLEKTRAAARRAHDAGLWVEAELGFVGGKAGPVLSAHEAGVRTDPDEAAAFVAATEVDALAVAIGSTHAMTTRSSRLDLDLVARLHDRLDVPLVLHGSSGVPLDQLRDAVRAGITKVNVGTALNVALTNAVRGALADTELVDPRRWLSPARAAMADTVRELLTVLAAARAVPRDASGA
jgi:fructose-bisphosphate aldolase, class II